MREPDFSYITLKVNAAGSWAKVMRFPVSVEQEVRLACKVLAQAAESRMKFKLADDADGALEILESGFLTEWKKVTR